MKIEKTNYEGIYQTWKNDKRVLLTKSIDGKNFFSEHIIDGYREIDPRRSKLAAAVIKKISKIPIRENDKVLYLGAGHGYTPSFISDIIKDGVIYCIDFAPRVVRDLIILCEERKNMIPILASANLPESYKNKVEMVDVIYQDVAQKNQVDILFKNLIFLKKNGYVILCIKARSIDVLKKPRFIFNQVKEELNKRLNVIDYRELDPMERDHCLFICRLD